MCRRLNEAEGVLANDTDRWGGSDNVIGSPRSGGSQLKPEEVLAIVRAACDEIAE